MLKWLSTTRHSTLTITDDPLATITVDKPLQVYAVSRVNPIFKEEEDERSKRIGGVPGSSGYSSQSQPSASEWSSGEDSVTILEQHAGYVKSILISVRGPLSPIPEGKVVPRPVWPRYQRRQRKPPAVQADDLFLYNSSSGQNNVQKKIHQRPEQVLRDLSHTISLAVDQKAVPPEEVLRTLGETINRSLEALSASAGRDPLYDSSSASSSGFSDLTPTPTSSSSESRLHDSNMIYGVLHNHKPGSGYEKLCPPEIQPPPPIYEAPPAPTKTQLQTKKTSDTYVCRGPDFTLDVHQAERLMRKLKASKRQRCWCRVVTSMMALFFFLLSVMVVSMILTRGKRVFGSLCNGQFISSGLC
ncbi:uncharacterized protein LOC142320981 [Lycorma delicatula]|uniref:uncharacterized protein LOC142320981 n=1 Tax=Lycorma delicatula TaxID=130591 RepID=UPI003F51A2D9